VVQETESKVTASALGSMPGAPVEIAAVSIPEHGLLHELLAILIGNIPIHEHTASHRLAPSAITGESNRVVNTDLSTDTSEQLSRNGLLKGRV